jgi:hypothetical protein
MTTLSPECPIEAWLAGEPHPCVKPRGHDGGHDFQPTGNDPTYDELADSLRLAHSRIQGLESTLGQVREVVRRQEAIIQRMSTRNAF